MKIINHGNWTSYKPNPIPKEAPPNALFCSNQGGVDWYVYSRTNFKDKNSIKMTIMFENDGKGPKGQVMAANKDVSFLFPQHLSVIEVFGLTSNDPQEEFGRMIYDSESQTFSENPVTVFGTIQEIVHLPPEPQPLPEPDPIETPLPQPDENGQIANVTIAHF